VRLTPAFVSNSQIGAEFLIRAFALAREKLAIVHNGVELAPAVDTRDSWRKRLGISERCFVTCMIANIPHFKDHITLLRAWKLVSEEMRSQDREAVLLLAGQLFPEADQIKVLAFDLNLGSSVKCLGMVRDISGLLSAVDLGVFSSKLEGCPNGVLECMASGLAVVGTDIPGIREAVGSDGTEWLAPPDDPNTFAQRVLDLANNPEKRSSLGAANRQRISAEFSREQMVNKMVTEILKGLGHLGHSLHG
jgi:glycosyltransferase involved in cell wall biosynthesis